MTSPGGPNHLLDQNCKELFNFYHVWTAATLFYKIHKTSYLHQSRHDLEVCFNDPQILHLDNIFINKNLLQSFEFNLNFYYN